MKTFNLSKYYLRDLILAFLLLVILSPLLVIAYILILIFFRENPIFVQNRLGFQCTTFNLYKFKTMRTVYDKSGQLLDDKYRLTKFGKILRSMSIDELPQLLNVLKNEMSLVGPRPLYVHYKDLYSIDQLRRHDVKPGITGWAQINGRNAISWQSKFKLDVWYVDNKTFLLDCKIIIRTLIKIIKRSDINSFDNVTSENFNGTN